MKGGYPSSDREPRWKFLLQILAVIAIAGWIMWTLVWAFENAAETDKLAREAATSIVEWTQDVEENIEDLNADLLQANIANAAMQKRLDAMDAQIKVLREEASSKTVFANIHKIDTVCHTDRRAWAIRYLTDSGEESWFIVPKQENWNVHFGYVAAKECDGTEEIHPRDRDKILEELNDKG